MAYGYVDDTYFKDIANSIRSKTGSVTNYYPGDMANAINNISGGGSNLGTKTITANGLYNASDDSLDGYNSVTVAVPMPTFNTDVLNVSANGVYNALTSGLDGYSEVNVQVPSSFNSTDLTVTSNGVYNAQLSGYDGYVEVNVQVPSGGADLSNFVTALDENNQPIGLDGMYVRATSNFNKPVVIGDNVTNCEYMFYATNFNSHVTIGNNVQNCYEMFGWANNFNQPVNIPDSVISCTSMFTYANKFNSPVKFSNNCAYYSDMFNGCENFNQPISFSSVATDLRNMLRNAKNFNQPIYIQSDDISSLDQFMQNCWNFNSNIEIHGDKRGIGTNAQNAFSRCWNLNSPVILDVGLNNAYRLFCECNNFNAPVSFADPIGFNTNAYEAFAYCNNFNQPINLPYNFYGNNMFVWCNSLNQNLNITFGRQTYFNYFFKNCLSIGGNFYIESSYIYGVSQMLNTQLHDKVVNIFSFNTAPFIQTTAYTSITGTDITWSEMDNGYYNEAYNIYIYNNYLGIIWDGWSDNRFQNNAQFNLPIRTAINVQSMNRIVNNCTNFNSPIYTNSGLRDCIEMLNGCINFNYPIEFPFNVLNANNCMENCISMKSDIIIHRSTMNIPKLLANANYEGNIYFVNGLYLQSGYSHISNMFYGKTNDTGMINMFVTNTFIQTNDNFNANFTGRTEEWVGDEVNHLVYSPTANIYIHTDWDGVIPS